MYSLMTFFSSTFGTCMNDLGKYIRIVEALDKTEEGKGLI